MSSWLWSAATLGAAAAADDAADADDDARARAATLTLPRVLRAFSPDGSGMLEAYFLPGMEAARQREGLLAITRALYAATWASPRQPAEQTPPTQDAGSLIDCVATPRETHWGDSGGRQGFGAPSCGVAGNRRRRSLARG